MPQQPSLGSIAVLIPAWKPEPQLVPIIIELLAAGIGAVLLIDDGNQADTLIEQASAIPCVHLARHAINLGKGRALKTGINLFLNDYPHFTGLVTADADGQHTVPDILAVANRLAAESTRVILGSRVFSPDVPLRSRFGNVLTRRIFAFVTGVSLADTQTGLRGVPAAQLPALLSLEGERYEYEMTMLSHLCRHGERPVEVPIATVYIDGNRSSHFDPLRDSMRIYFVLLRFYLSSLIAAGVDLAGFSAAFLITHNILASVVIGRLSSLVNFALNRSFVFHNRASVGGAIGRYYALAVAIAGSSYFLIWSLATYLHWNVFAAKITIDVMLSFVSFAAQRTFVFRREQDSA